MPLESGTITVGCTDDTVVIDVIGAGSHFNSYPLESFVITMLEASAQRFIVNLAHCSQLDSTFLGVMVGLSQRLGEAGKQQLCIANAQGPNLHLIKRLGLNHLVELADRPIPDLEAPTDLEAGPITKLERGRHMLAAHRRLSELNEANRDRFADLIKTLKANVARHEREG